MLSRRNVLVTGGCGYAGSVAVRRLLAAGCRVRVLDLFLFGADTLPADDRATVFRGDVRDERAVAEAVAGCDSVVHLAGIGDAASFDLDPIAGCSVNLQGLECVLQQSRAAGVSRFLQISSTEVYGGARLGDERGLLAPDSPLGICQALAEDVVVEAYDRGLAATIFRCAPLCGASPRMRFDLPLNELAARVHALHEAPAALLQRSLTSLHVEDLAGLVVAALSWPEDLAAGGVYNVAAPCPPDRLYTALAEALQCNPREDSAALDSPSEAAASLRVERELGWRPGRDVAAAVRELADLLGDGRIAEPLSEPRYHNVEMLKRQAPGALRRAA